MIVLDTHVLIWVVDGQTTLGRIARELIFSAWRNHALGLSVYSFWEIALLQSKQKLFLSIPIRDWRQRVLGLGIDEIPVTAEICMEAAQLGEFHRDPADRLITATAIIADAMLVTADQRILDWPGNVSRQDARS